MHLKNRMSCGVFVVQGRSSLAGPQAGRSFPRKSFVRPSWMDEDTVDSADASESLFFSKVSSSSRSHPFGTRIFAAVSFLAKFYVFIRLSLFTCFFSQPPFFSVTVFFFVCPPVFLAVCVSHTATHNMWPHVNYCPLFLSSVSCITSVQGDVRDELYSMADDVFESPPLSASFAPCEQPSSLWVNINTQPKSLNCTHCVLFFFPF